MPRQAPFTTQPPLPSRYHATEITRPDTFHHDTTQNRPSSASVAPTDLPPPPRFSTTKSAGQLYALRTNRPQHSNLHYTPLQFTAQVNDYRCDRQCSHQSSPLCTMGLDCAWNAGSGQRPCLRPHNLLHHRHHYCHPDHERLCNRGLTTHTPPTRPHYHPPEANHGTRLSVAALDLSLQTPVSLSAIPTAGEATPKQSCND